MNLIRAEVITIGDEILYGQILDTNAQWICQELSNAGIKLVRKTTIGDVREDILTNLSQAEAEADIVLITGGLGPTTDDITKPVLAEYFGADLKINNEALVMVTNIFAKMGKDVTPTNQKQAELPVNCEMMPNDLGTAPGMWFDERGTVFVSMPGVPFEMKQMMEQSILPKLKQRFDVPAIVHKVVQTIGIGESWLADRIKDWEQNLPENIKLAFLPNLGQVRLRLTGIGNEQNEIEKQIQNQIDLLLPSIEKFVFGYDKDTISSAVGALLLESNNTIATAESCTGGYLAHLITSVPGSAAYYKGSVLSYSNEVKREQLDVPANILEEHGAVCEETVLLMAENVRKKLNTSIGIATSGIAGPDGGTVEKPIGTVWLAVADGKKSVAKRIQLSKDRGLNIKASSIAALNLVRQRLLELD